MNDAKYADQSFTRLDDRLYCQCCKKFIDEGRKSSVDRHLGLDRKQSGNSNEGTKHRENLMVWNGIQNLGNATGDNANGNIRHSVYGDLNHGFVLIMMKAGCNACQSAYIAREFFRNYPMTNSGTVPQREDGM